MITPSAAWTFAAIVSDQPLNGEIDLLSGIHRSMADHLAGIPPGERTTILTAMATALPDGPAFLQSVFDADPSKPCPVRERRRAAHTGDLSAASESNRFIWKNWITRSHFTLLSSHPKVGKTRFALEIAKRIYTASLWPDGQPATFPVGTKTLWVCGDRHQDELRAAEQEHGLPVGTILFNALPEEPYGGWDLDNPDNVNLLHELIRIERPGLVFIDTVWRATRRRLYREDEVNTLMNPIITIAQECDTAIVGLMHLSKDMDTLGRRLEGLSRGVMKMFKPDPGQPNRRRLEVVGNFKDSPPLGITLRDGGCDFDSNPPSDVVRNPGGRPPVKCEAAVQFLTEKLASEDRKWCDLVKEWLDKGEAKPRIFDARTLMEEDGRLVVDDSGKLLVCHLVKESDNGCTL